jgi:hypothetical protein
MAHKLGIQKWDIQLIKAICPIGEIYSLSSAFANRAPMIIIDATIENMTIKNVQAKPVTNSINNRLSKNIPHLPIRMNPSPLYT